jgi:hypothetical protein
VAGVGPDPPSGDRLLWGPSRLHPTSITRPTAAQVDAPEDRGLIFKHVSIGTRKHMAVKHGYLTKKIRVI